MDDKNSPKLAKIFYCEICDYKCCKSSDLHKHLLTAKHGKRTNGGQNMLTFGDFSPTENICNCGKAYKYRQGLWKHQKNCKMAPLGFKNHQELIQTIIHDNQEFKQMLLEQNAKLMELSNKNMVITNNMTTNNNNTTNNFNLHVFLNVECKDAINIMDFVDSLEVQIQDLEETGRVGYINGISRIIINGLNDLDINKRPIHCSDLKRETIYIKDQDVWEKDNEDKDKLKLAIKTIASKNIKQIPIWQKEHPDYSDSSSKTNDKYLKIVSNAMNGSTVEETQKNYNKIISKVAKEVVIQK